MEKLDKLILTLAIIILISLLLIALIVIIGVTIRCIKENVQKRKNTKEINKMEDFKKIKVKFKDVTKLCMIEIKQYNSNNCYVVNKNGEIGEIGEIDFNDLYTARGYSSLFVETVRPLSLDDILNLRSNNDITTKEDLVKLIKKNFRDEDGGIDLCGLDFSGEDVYVSYMKAKNLFQTGQEVENNLFQSRQTVGVYLFQNNQTVGGYLFQNNQEVGGKVSQDEDNQEITTKEELVELIKKNFRYEDGTINLKGLDFSGENVYMGYMKAKNLFQNNQKVSNNLYQSRQTVCKNLYQQYQEVGNSLHQHNQEVKGSIFQDEFKKDITTTEELVKLIKKNFRDEDGDINLRRLDFSGENVYIDCMKAKNLFQNLQEVEKNLFQNRQTVGGYLFQGYQKVSNDLYQQYQEVKNTLFQDNQKVGNNLYQYNQKVDGYLYQQNQEVEGEIFQDEANTDRSVTKKMTEEDSK